jgi:hypothetical protein
MKTQLCNAKYLTADSRGSTDDVTITFMKEMRKDRDGCLIHQPRLLSTSPGKQWQYEACSNANSSDILGFDDCNPRFQSSEPLMNGTLQSLSKHSSHPECASLSTAISTDGSSLGGLSSTRGRRRASTLHHNHSGVRHRSMSSASTPIAPLNIEDALSIHQQSCDLYYQLMTSPAAILPPASVSPGNMAFDYRLQQQRSASLSMSTAQGEVTAESDDEEYEIPPPVIMHWTSTQTRQAQYAEIDKWSKGMRGFWRRVAPRWFFRRAMQRFHESDKSDIGSVRRYRLELPDDEKSIISTNHNVANRKISMSCFGS